MVVNRRKFAVASCDFAHSLHFWFACSSVQIGIPRIWADAVTASFWTWNPTCSWSAGIQGICWFGSTCYEPLTCTVTVIGPFLSLLKLCRVWNVPVYGHYHTSWHQVIRFHRCAALPVCQQKEEVSSFTTGTLSCMSVNSGLRCVMAHHKLWCFGM